MRRIAVISLLIPVVSLAGMSVTAIAADPGPGSAPSGPGIVYYNPPELEQLQHATYLTIQLDQDSTGQCHYPPLQLSIPSSGQLAYDTQLEVSRDISSCRSTIARGFLRPAASPAAGVAAQGVGSSSDASADPLVTCPPGVCAETQQLRHHKIDSVDAWWQDPIPVHPIHVSEAINTIDWWYDGFSTCPQRTTVNSYTSQWAAWTGWSETYNSWSHGNDCSSDVSSSTLTHQNSLFCTLLVGPIPPIIQGPTTINWNPSSITGYLDGTTNINIQTTASGACNPFLSFNYSLTDQSVPGQQ